MTAEETAASVISKVGLWWPLADQDRLRQAAAAYEQVALAVLAAAATGASGAKLVTGGGNQGKAVDAVAKHWSIYDGGPQAGLPATAQATEKVATALNQFADKVEEAKGKITDLAIEIGATLAVGVGLALFTFGTSAGAAAARTAMLVARGIAIGAGLTGVAATIVSTVLVGIAGGALEGFVSSIVAQTAKIVLSDGEGISLTEAAEWTGFGAAGGGLFTAAGLALRGGFRALRRGRLASRLDSPAGVKSWGTVRTESGENVELWMHRWTNGGVTADLNERGTMSLLIERGSGTPRGGEMFNEALAHFGSRVQRVKGVWNTAYPDNLDIFNLAVKLGVTPEQAASHTFTGKMAARHGFTKPRIIELEGQPGSYTAVQVMFERRR